MMTRTKTLFVVSALLGSAVSPAFARDRHWRAIARGYCAPAPQVSIAVATPHYYTVARPVPSCAPAYCPPVVRRSVTVVRPAPVCPPTAHYYTPSYETMAVGPEVAASVQRSLAYHGYYQGDIDGVLGPQSVDAIRFWQADRGLEVTGALDSPTLRSLGLLN